MKFKQGLIASAAVIVVLVVVYLLGYFSGKGSNLVDLRVENRARQTIGSAVVQFTEGTARIDGVNTGSTKKTEFYLPKKSEYRLIVTFRDNRTVRTELRSVNPGETITEIVTDSAVVRTYN